MVGNGESIDNVYKYLTLRRLLARDRDKDLHMATTLNKDNRKRIGEFFTGVPVDIDVQYIQNYSCNASRYKQTRFLSQSNE